MQTTSTSWLTWATTAAPIAAAGCASTICRPAKRSKSQFEDQVAQPRSSFTTVACVTSTSLSRVIRGSRQPRPLRDPHQPAGRDAGIAQCSTAVSPRKAPPPTHFGTHSCSERLRVAHACGRAPAPRDHASDRAHLGDFELGDFMSGLEPFTDWAWSPRLTIRDTAGTR